MWCAHVHAGDVLVVGDCRLSKRGFIGKFTSPGSVTAKFPFGAKRQRFLAFVFPVGKMNRIYFYWT